MSTRSLRDGRIVAPHTHPKTGRVAVKVINHYGDEVMKVFRV
jgi:hypothetical protein